MNDPAAPDESLAGLTVLFYMRLAGADSYLINGVPARIVDAAERRVAFDWRPGDTDVPGMYTYRWAVVYDGLEWSNPTREKPLEIAGIDAVVPGLPWATSTDAQRYTASADGAEPIRLQFVLEDASEMVARMAPAPSTMTQDYARRAKRAELRLFEWLWTTKGYVASKSVQHLGSVNYDPKAARRIVRETMGPYAQGSGLRSVPIARG